MFNRDLNSRPRNKTFPVVLLVVFFGPHTSWGLPPSTVGNGSTMELLVACLVAVAGSLVLTPLIRKFARERGIVAGPRGDRWHKNPTAMLGGVAIYCAFVAGFLIFSDQLPGGARLVLAGASVLFLVGLVDDLIVIKPPVKLALQLIVASVVVYFGRRLPWTDSNALNIFITIFWLVGMTNAINLLDNMDGLAAGIVAIACAFMAATFLLNGQTAEAMLPLLLGGAALGFLVFNFSPASIFMGDCGSLFLGFALGGTALLSTYDRTRHLGTVLVAPVLIMLIPIFDTFIVAVTRKLAGRPISQGGRDHTSHRLVGLGISERRAVQLLFSLSLASGVLALVVRQMQIQVMVAVLAVFLLLLVSLGLYLSKVRVYEDGTAPPNSAMLRALVGFTYKRRVFEILLDVVLIALAYQSAFLLRFDGRIPGEQMEIFLRTLPLVVALEMSFLLIGGVYSGLWRYVSTSDLVVLGRSGALGAVVSALFVFGMFGWSGPSRAVFVLNALLLMVFVAVSRFSFRLLRTVIVGKKGFHPDARPVFIYGAGDRGELLIRELLNSREYRYAPVGFIDDDLTKVGKVIHGVPIFPSARLEELIERHSVRDILISSPKVPEGKLRHLESLGVHLGRLQIRIEREVTDPSDFVAA